ncbi:uncharacterized protein I206_104470 [Kwoniella pini CBS 10737]|uniref:Uncharacterized protein n=1 Tax=Kwoniella pini CBS 10737 TaxID=1296096 RepID=A0A1B9I712_9TREE|nr:uncharacterized protein I206_02000 [Kwoniella pini CBS 10737]OCF51286.1 hypothetical protein I206_02000 [Kwoniella pini CBS 10737]
MPPKVTLRKRKPPQQATQDGGDKKRKKDTGESRSKKADPEEEEDDAEDDDDGVKRNEKEARDGDKHTLPGSKRRLQVELAGNVTQRGDNKPDVVTQSMMTPEKSGRSNLPLNLHVPFLGREFKLPVFDKTSGNHLSKVELLYNMVLSSPKGVSFESIWRRLCDLEQDRDVVTKYISARIETFKMAYSEKMQDISDEIQQELVDGLLTVLEDFKRTVDGSQSHKNHLLTSCISKMMVRLLLTDEDLKNPFYNSLRSDDSSRPGVPSEKFRDSLDELESMTLTKTIKALFIEYSTSQATIDQTQDDRSELVGDVQEKLLYPCTIVGMETVVPDRFLKEYRASEEGDLDKAGIDPEERQDSFTRRMLYDMKVKFQPESTLGDGWRTLMKITDQSTIAQTFFSAKESLCAGLDFKFRKIPIEQQNCSTLLSKVYEDDPQQADLDEPKDQRTVIVETLTGVLDQINTSGSLENIHRLPLEIAVRHLGEDRVNYQMGNDPLFCSINTMFAARNGTRTGTEAISFLISLELQALAVSIRLCKIRSSGGETGEYDTILRQIQNYQRPVLAAAHTVETVTHGVPPPATPPPQLVKSKKPKGKHTARHTKVKRFIGPVFDLNSTTPPGTGKNLVYFSRYKRRCETMLRAQIKPELTISTYIREMMKIGTDPQVVAKAYVKARIVVFKHYKYDLKFEIPLEVQQDVIESLAEALEEFHNTHPTRSTTSPTPPFEIALSNLKKDDKIPETILARVFFSSVNIDPSEGVWLPKVSLDQIPVVIHYHELETLATATRMLRNKRERDAAGIEEDDIYWQEILDDIELFSDKEAKAERLAEDEGMRAQVRKLRKLTLLSSFSTNLFENSSVEFNNLGLTYQKGYTLDEIWQSIKQSRPDSNLHWNDIATVYLCCRFAVYKREFPDDNMNIAVKDIEFLVETLTKELFGYNHDRQYCLPFEQCVTVEVYEGNLNQKTLKTTMIKSVGDDEPLLPGIPEDQVLPTLVRLEFETMALLEHLLEDYKSCSKLSADLDILSTPEERQKTHDGMQSLLDEIAGKDNHFELRAWRLPQLFTDEQMEQAQEDSFNQRKKRDGRLVQDADAWKHRPRLIQRAGAAREKLWTTKGQREVLLERAMKNERVYENDDCFTDSE